jgi:hypothetical protein
VTQIQPRQPVKRQTAASCFNSPIIVELYPHHLTLRLKGHTLGYDFYYAKLLRRSCSWPANATTRQEFLNRIVQRAS